MTSKTYELRIDSDDCIGDYHKFIYVFRNAIRGYTSFYIKSAEITNLFLPFRLDKNDKFYYYKKIVGVPTLRTLQISKLKIFNMQTLSEHLNTLITNLGDNADVNFTYDTSTFLLSFNVLSNLYRPIGIEELKTLNKIDHANYRLGYTEEYTTYQVFNYVSDQPINLLPTKSIYIRSSLCDYPNETSNKFMDRVLLKMPLTNNFGSICFYFGSTRYDLIDVDRTGQFLTSIDFELFNDWGEELDLNGGSFSISLVFLLP
jgi:hypothetical protein